MRRCSTELVDETLLKPLSLSLGKVVFEQDITNQIAFVDRIRVGLDTGGRITATDVSNISCFIAKNIEPLTRFLFVRSASATNTAREESALCGIRLKSFTDQYSSRFSYGGYSFV